eukprot:scaffold33757_cov39-Phaeocystis_antarctica.AAC.2
MSTRSTECSASMRFSFCSSPPSTRSERETKASGLRTHSARSAVSRKKEGIAWMVSHQPGFGVAKL